MAYDALFQLYAGGYYHKLLRPTIDDGIKMCIKFQHLNNRSGNETTGGLSETKTYMNLTAIWSDIPRPEDGEPCYTHIHMIDCLTGANKDGPPLRAMFILKYADWILDNENNEDSVDNTLWPAIYLDLSWISRSWNRTS